MIDLAFLWNCDFFTKVSLEKNEILFDEWAEDTNLYIIYEGELGVEKKIQSGTEYKVLSYIRTGNILWEGWLSNRGKKEVRIRASRKTILLKIVSDAFIDFVSRYPKESYELLIHIISHANDRLLKANSEITANYEISQAIAHIKNFDNTSIEKLLHTMKIILNSESIMYLEKNSVIAEYYKLKYLQGGVQESLWEDLILHFPDDSFSLEVLKNQKPTLLATFAITASIIHWGSIKWYLIISRKQKKYSENEQKLLENAAISFAWVIGHKEILEADVNKKYIKNI